jgi:hypothetical protein
MFRVAVLVSVCLIAAAAHAAAAPVVTARYVGNINGARATAVVSFERLPEYTVMAGRIQSGRYVYTFRADIVGAAGYGEIVSHAENTRFQIYIQLTQTGFALTSNPLGPGTPTTYHFKRY